MLAHVGTDADLVVIGGGTAGIVAARIAAGLGARVLVVEAGRLGGDCLWSGCVPSKRLVAAAAAAATVRRAADHGLKATLAAVDMGQVMATVRAAQGRLEPEDSRAALESDGVEVVAAAGRFDGPGRIVAGTRTLRYASALVATGSTPAWPAISGLDDTATEAQGAGAPPAVTVDTVWDLTQLPDHLLVLGGGPSGCELAQAFARLGARVTVIERESRLLPAEDETASAAVRAALTADGATVSVGATVGACRAIAGRWELDIVGRDETVTGSHVLVVTGRRPRSYQLGLETVGVATDQRGAITVDDRLRTSAPGILAAGDVTGVAPFTHVAAYQARLAVPQALFGLGRRADYRAVPRVVFTDPEVAAVGCSEREAQARWGRLAVTVRVATDGLDRVVVSGRDIGGDVVLVGDPRGRLVGATVIGPSAGEVIAELVARIEHRDPISSLSRAVHAYPTYAEGPSRAADKLVRARWTSPTIRRLAPLAIGIHRRLAGRG